MMTPSRSAWILLASAASLAASPALAQEWTEYTQTAEFRAFVDLKSVKTEGNLLRAWEKLDYTLSQRDARGKPYRTTLGNWAVNCRQRTSAITALGYKATGGETVWFNRQPRNQWEFAGYPEGSAGAQFIRLVCADTQSTEKTPSPVH